MSATSSLTRPWSAESTRRPSASSGDSNALSTASVMNSSTSRMSRCTPPQPPRLPPMIRQAYTTRPPATFLANNSRPHLPHVSRPDSRYFRPAALGLVRRAGSVSKVTSNSCCSGADDRRPGGRVGLGFVLAQPRDPGGDQDALEVALGPQLPTVGGRHLLLVPVLGDRPDRLARQHPLRRLPDPGRLGGHDRLVGAVPVDDLAVRVVDGALVPVGTTAAVGPPVLGQLEVLAAQPAGGGVGLVLGDRALDPQRQHVV